MKRKKKRDPLDVEHGPTNVLPNGLRVRSGGTIGKGWKSKYPMGPDGFLIVPTEIIHPRPVGTRALPRDPYTGEE